MKEIMIPANVCDSNCQFFVEIGENYARCALFKKEIYYERHSISDYKKCDECFACGQNGDVIAVNIKFEKDVYPR